ncbi:hypothetical protein N7448_002600 [Penicillium atrosanguineum]|uniref:Uncharacterized protein n=1 Tax=Penicillium atrosanguineum TaxID=1132637 RepID=A0A9W9LAY0_9EURO|nr:uncharacterized protein N7443_006005 [Penicillium atrosanguineum]KAJ5128890.1 hypothetical protein N7526_007056 [Penicillium atrosanguineum]KAJ5145208.1 hypothetical protein N7448_002600 [Penicillium atrosanguineum]KAJ5301003.1 hypothetical protein N7443_006005 [Penicillium atrosanguineum]KAJ5311647.1 hypothetical protein N7476_007507 [Penicillium atrosanguineum]
MDDGSGVPGRAGTQGVRTSRREVRSGLDVIFNLRSTFSVEKRSMLYSSYSSYSTQPQVLSGC